jgi:hypothetical protein
MHELSQFGKQMSISMLGLYYNLINKISKKFTHV